MITYPCKTCGEHTEIEELEVAFGHSEPYEFDQCQSCFDKDVSQ